MISVRGDTFFRSFFASKVQKILFLQSFCYQCFRPYWRCYYSNTDAIIYVVDSADRDRIGISKQELVSMLEVCRIIWINKSASLVRLVVERFSHFGLVLSGVIIWDVDSPVNDTDPDFMVSQSFDSLYVILTKNNHLRKRKPKLVLTEITEAKKY
jgi:hypothetical protein